ncbi:TPA: putative phage abortive infection protein [Yersinia enterocolitica]
MKSNEKMTFIIGVAVMIATWVSADSSRKSSFIAQKAFEDNLRSSKSNNFEQHYNSLFALHNDLHNSVCDFLDTADKKDHDEKNIIGGKSYFNSIRKMDTLEDAHNTLMGHSVISPYMRVLYHLLKHIFSYTDDPDVFKKYTSPLRSMVRNDVLYLVALNTAVIYRGDSLDDNGYQEFQEYLQKSDFFEHTIFTADQYKNFNEVRNKLESDFEQSFNNPIRNYISNYVEALEIQKNVIDLPKDLILCVIFKNPFTPLINSYINSISQVVNESYDSNFDRFHEIKNRKLNILNDLCAYYEKKDKEKVFMLINDFATLRYIANNNKDNYTVFFVRRSNAQSENCINVANWIVELDKVRGIFLLHENNKLKINSDLDNISKEFFNMLDETINKYKVNG